jgi:hypothetical protein
MIRVVNHQVDLPEVTATSRRHLLASLIAGTAAVAAAPLFAGRASAAEEKAPRDPKDFPSLNEALKRERQMTATYAAAVAQASGDEKVALTLLHDHHAAYVDAIKGYLGSDAIKSTEAALASGAGSITQIASQMASLEDQTVTLHTDRLGTLVGHDAATLVASIITMEARHAAALALVGGASPLAAVGA